MEIHDEKAKIMQDNYSLNYKIYILTTSFKIYFKDLPFTY